MQEQKREERSVAKSKSTAMNFVFTCSGMSLNRENSDCIWKPRDTQSDRKLKAGWEEIRIPTATSSQARLQDAYLGGLMDTATGELVATKEESGDVDLSESETWTYSWIPLFQQQFTWSRLWGEFTIRQQ